MNIGYGSAHGKVILMGEHAVVYRQPALALPLLSALIETEVISYSGPIHLNSYCFDGFLEDVPELLKGVQTLIFRTLEYLKREKKNLKISIKSNIPAQRGLGSSAAVSISIVRALFNYYKVDLNNDVLFSLVDLAENIHHKSPSGLDMYTIIGQRPIYFQKDKSIKTLNINMDAELIVADSGIFGCTKTAVGHLQKTLQSNPEKKEKIYKIGNLVSKAEIALEDGDVNKLGILMQENHEILRELKLSHERLDQLIDVSMQAGAMGAKLTGGGHGGCIIALVPKKRSQIVEEALKTAGVKHLWKFDLKELAYE